MERVGIEGILRVYEIPDDRVRSVDELKDFPCLVKRNLILNNGLSAISRLLGDNQGSPTVGGSGINDLTDITINRMELGNALSPTAPAVGDTTGVTSLLYAPALVVTYPTPYTVVFSGLVPISQFVNSVFTEEALKMANGMIFARTIFSVTKTNSAALQFNHTISVSRI